jgi:CheY-like chemotaxis protein
MRLEQGGGPFVHFRGFGPDFQSNANLGMGEKMDRTSVDGMPDDLLIVEDDPIIALDFEDTILGFGVKTVRIAGSVARALELIEQRAPQFALLDVSLIREKSFAVAERLEALRIPFAFVTGYGADVLLPAALAAKPRLPKPYSTDALQSLLKSRATRP